jgi:hypothetical protein
VTTLLLKKLSAGELVLLGVGHVVTRAGS